MKIARAARRRLGKLVEIAEQTVAAAIRGRGGNAANVKEAGDWADRTLAEAAAAAVEGDKSAAKAIKIAKQARRLGRKFGGDAL